MADKSYSCDEADKVLEACARAAHEANRAYSDAIGKPPASIWEPSLRGRTSPSIRDPA